MNRKLERNLIKGMGIWQIIDGLITIIIYGFYFQKIIPNGLQINEKFSNTYGSSLFILTCSFGTLLIGLGLINVMISHKYIKDDVVIKKNAYFIFTQSIFSYFVVDYISLVLSITSVVLLLAKNKSIKIKLKLN